MTDVADRADSEIERANAEALRHRRPDGPPAIGKCLYCDHEPMPAGQRWCDRWCEAQWEHEQDRKAANRRLGDE